jgi:hypothetical protein
MILYKYSGIDKYLDDTIINNQLFFNKPPNFNDPFDCNYLIDTNCSAQEKTDYITSQMTAQNFQTSEIDKAVNLAINDDNYWKSLITQGAKRYLDHIGVCCFSKTNENPLLWAHYSIKHTGICLIFDTDKDKSLFDKTYSVKYRSNYPKINFIKNRNRFDELVLTKSIDWIYEQEVRAMKDTGAQLYKFNKSSFIGVIFGCKSASSEITRIKSLLDSNGYSYKSEKASLRQGSFGLDFNSI